MPVDATPGPVTVTVSNAGSESPAFSLTLAETAPAIFTSGAGAQGAILIAGTASVATQAQPARRGQAVEIYCTGLGADLSTTMVTVGGRQSRVLYAGPAPGFPGLQQVNATVPADAGTGAAVPVTVQVRGVVSNTATMGVRD
jgi:uncharacterized protein (TIGR03437 family)